MAGAMYFNIRSFLHLVGASAQKESCAINLGNEYVCCAEDWKTTLDKIGNFSLTIENNQIKNDHWENFKFLENEIKQLSIKINKFNNNQQI